MQCYSDGKMVLSEQKPPAAADLTNMTAICPNPTPGVGRRDRKKLATRQALRNAALQLVAERGFANVTVEDIAEAADVATRTFFNYFPTKESAVIGAHPERVEQMRVSLLARPVRESSLKALGSVLVEYAGRIDEEFDDLGEGKEAWFQRFSAAREDPDLLGAYTAHMAEVEQALVAAMAERLGTDPYHDPYPALVVATALAATRVAALYWSANGGVGPLARLTSAAIDSLAKGLVHERPAISNRATPSEVSRKR